MESIHPVLTNGIAPFDVSGGLEQAKNHFLLDPLSNNPELGAGWRAGGMSSAFEQPLTLSAQEAGNPSSGFDDYNFSESSTTTLEAKASNLSSETGVFTAGETNDPLIFGGNYIATVVPEPGNTLRTAYNVGTLSGTRTFTDRISSSDTNDYYRFSLGSASNFNLSLTGMSADADVQLLDSNGNSITYSRRSGSGNESINRALAAGTYFVRVYQYSGNTNYTLNLSTTPPSPSTTPSNLLPTETDVGILNGTRTFSDAVGSTDTSDIYRFNLGASSNINLTLSGLSNDADVRLIRDANNNGIVDPNEEIQRSSSGSNYSEGINSSLGAGNYFVQVYQYSGDTNYNLSLSTGDWYSQNLSDPGIIGQARTFAADGQLSRNDMMAILRETKDYGSIDSVELTDLHNLLAGRGSLMPEYVRVLSGKVIDGNPANARSGIGNLFAGSSATQMEQLIGKWFLGTDRPTLTDPNNISYRRAEGELFRRAEGEQNDILYTDINQGSLNDCFLMASLGATARHTPQAIHDMFIDNGDGTWTVRFFLYTDPNESVQSNVVDYVTVDRYLPTWSNGNGFAYANRDLGLAYNDSSNELWVALAEKAYAQLHPNGYTQLDQGGSSHWTLRHITGRFTDRLFSLNTADRAAMVSAFNAGQLVTIQGNLPNGDLHEWVLTEYNSNTDQYTLYNPWGPGNDSTLSGSELASYTGYTRTV